MDLKRIQQRFVSWFKKTEAVAPNHARSSESQFPTGGAHTAKPPREKRSLEEVLADLRQHVHERVAGGFDDEGQIIQSGVDYLYDEAPPETLRSYSEQFTREELEFHKTEQAAWPATTDCDRLDNAFAELERAGIVARQNFTCCQTCGNAEIGDELTAAKEKGITPHGYTFYHMQDTDRAVNGSGLYLAFAAKTDAVAVAKQIIATLERHGLQPKWDGSVETRIFLPIDWKRRR